MHTTVKNWTLLREVEVCATGPHGEIPALAGIRADGGSLRFQFDMTAEQARRMAAALVEAAEVVEAYGEVTA